MLVTKAPSSASEPIAFISTMRRISVRWWVTSDCQKSTVARRHVAPAA